MKKELITFFLEAFFLFSYVFTSIFYIVNTNNEDLNAEIAKPLWEIIILGIFFGFISAVAHILPSRNEKIR